MQPKCKDQTDSPGGKYCPQYNKHCQGNCPLNPLSAELLQKNISPSRHMLSYNLHIDLKLHLEKLF